MDTAGSPNVLSTANTTEEQRIPSVLNPVVIMNPSTVFQSPIITNAIAFPNQPSISSCVNSTSTYEFSNNTTPSFAIGEPFIVGDAKSNAPPFTTTPLTSSATMLFSTNYTTATFTSVTSSTAEKMFPKLVNTTAVLSRACTPVFSSSKHKSDAFTFRRPPTPPAKFSVPTTSSGIFVRSKTTDFNFTTNTATASGINNSSTAAFTFPNVTFNSTNATNTTGGFGTHATDVFTYPNPRFISTNATSTTGGLRSHSPDVFTFSNPTTVLFPNLSSTTIIFSKADTPVFSVSNHKASSLTFQRPANPLVTFSITTTSSFPSSRSSATVFNSKTATAYTNRLRHPSTATFTFSNPTFYSTITTSTAGRIGNRYPDAFTFSNPTTPLFLFPTTSVPTDVISYSNTTAYSNYAFTYPNPTFISTNATSTTGGLGSHSPDVFTFSNPTTVLFPNPSSTTITFSKADTPLFSVSNHKSPALTFQRPANPPVTFSIPTTSSFPSSRSTATVFNFTTATACTNRLRNPSTAAFTFSNPTFYSTITTSTAGRIGNRYPDAFAFSNPTPLFLFPTTSVPTFVVSYSDTTAYTNYAFGHPFNAPIFQHPRAVLRPSSTMFSFEDQANAAFTSPMVPTTGYGAPMFSTAGTPAFTSSNTTHSFLNTGDKTSRELMLSEPPNSESRFCQAACWNPRSNESMFSPSTNLPECTICADKERDIAFQPCGHLIVCSNCVNHIGILCPICRRVIKKKIKIYIS